MSQLLIKNANLILPDRVLANHSLLCDEGKIVQIGPANDFPHETTATVIDASGKYLAPGLIDLHIHGLHTYRIDNGPDDLENICKLLPQYGVTGFLPSVCPRPKPELTKFLGRLAKIKSQAAVILGFHLEGPFLTVTGALPPEAIGGTADPQRVRALIQAASPYRAIFSIAPDFEDIAELIPIMAQNNTPVFMTHTKASVSQTQEAIALGAKHATHFYDVFPAPTEVDPGVRHCGALEAILADPDVSVDFILDGEHVDPIAVKMALQCKGPDKVCLITDANVGAGLPPGKYDVFGREIEFAYQGGPARMTDKSDKPGVLDGSGLTMDLAVKNALKMLEVDLPQALRMASTNPAKVLGLKNKGQIEKEFDADMFLMDDNCQVLQTWIAGECLYKS